MRRRRLAGVAASVAGATLLGCGGSSAPAAMTAAIVRAAGTGTGGAGVGSAPAASRAPAAGRGGPYAVGEITLPLVDHRRTIPLPHHRREPRPETLIVRYPIPPAGRPRSGDVTGASPAAGPFPLVVFGHGYNVTPAPYAALLRSWTRAGYVVAAPLFPRTNPQAPGGPDENDIVEQPADMSFAITALLNANAATVPGDFFHGLLDPAAVAVAGQSDGGETAFAAAYDPPVRDLRVHAAVILSGAALPDPAFRFPRPGPPLLATQGTADVINLPDNTYRFFRAAPPPKFLLRLLGAPHLGPYTDEQPQLGVVERTTVAFLDRYLKRLPGSRARLDAAGRVPGIASLTTR